MDILDLLFETYENLKTVYGEQLAKLWITDSVSYKFKDLLDENRLTKENLIKLLKDDLDLSKAAKTSSPDDDSLNYYKEYSDKIVRFALNLNDDRLLKLEAERLGVSKRALIESLLHRYLNNELIDRKCFEVNNKQKN